MNTLPYMNPDVINHIWDLCVRTFNTFNGVINPTIKAAAIIVRPGYSGEFTYLAYTNQNVVNMYIYNLILCYDDPLIRDFSTAYTVLHELSHFEQDIDFDRYKTDMAYQEDIERANDNRTVGFILTHIREFGQVLNQPSESILLGLCKNMFPDTTKAEFKYLGIVKFYWNILRYFLNGSRSALSKVDRLLSNISYMDKLEFILLEFKDEATGFEESITVKDKFVYNANTFNMNSLIYRWTFDMMYYRNSDITIDDLTLYVKFSIKDKIRSSFLPYNP